MIRIFKNPAHRLLPVLLFSGLLSRLAAIVLLLALIAPMFLLSGPQKVAAGPVINHQ